MNKRDVALLILVRDDRRILLQHRTEDAPLWPGFWGFFGGGIDENESPREAVKREIFEELNYRLRKTKLFLIMDICQQDYVGTRYVFISIYDKKQRIKLREGKGFGWFTLDEALGVKINRYNRRAIELLKANSGLITI